jgi:hypothetical protein
MATFMLKDAVDQYDKIKSVISIDEATFMQVRILAIIFWISLVDIIFCISNTIFERYRD